MVFIQNGLGAGDFDMDFELETLRVRGSSWLRSLGCAERLFATHSPFRLALVHGFGGLMRVDGGLGRFKAV